MNQSPFTQTASRSAASPPGGVLRLQAAPTGSRLQAPPLHRPGRDRARPSERGFGLSELAVVLAVIGLTVAVGVPYCVAYLRSATLASGVQEVQDALVRAKQLAITTRQNICVEVTTSTTYRFRQVTCSGTPWTGVGTDASGYLRLQNSVRISNGGASPIFTMLGTATPGGTFTITAPSGASRTVTVTGGGRITAS